MSPIYTARSKELVLPPIRVYRNSIFLCTLHFTLLYVCPRIIYEIDERYQLDATILVIIINNSTCFGHLYAHLHEYIGCMLLHMVFSTKCCGRRPEEPACSLVHCV